MINPTESVWENLSGFLMDKYNAGEIKNAQETRWEVSEIMGRTIIEDGGEETAPDTMDDAVDFFIAAVNWDIIWEKIGKESKNEG